MDDVDKLKFYNLHSGCTSVRTCKQSKKKNDKSLK